MGLSRPGALRWAVLHLAAELGWPRVRFRRGRFAGPGRDGWALVVLGGPLDVATLDRLHLALRWRLRLDPRPLFPFDVLCERCAGEVRPPARVCHWCLEEREGKAG